MGCSLHHADQEENERMKGVRGRTEVCVPEFAYTVTQDSNTITLWVRDNTANIQKNYHYYEDNRGFVCI